MVSAEDNKIEGSEKHCVYVFPSRSLLSPTPPPPPSPPSPKEATAISSLQLLADVTKSVVTFDLHVRYVERETSVRPWRREEAPSGESCTRLLLLLCGILDLVGGSAARCSSPSSSSVLDHLHATPSPLWYSGPRGWITCTLFFSFLLPFGIPEPRGILPDLVVESVALLLSPPLGLHASLPPSPPLRYTWTPWLNQCTLFFSFLLPCGIPDPWLFSLLLCGIPDPVGGSLARYFFPFFPPLVFQTPWLFSLLLHCGIPDPVVESVHVIFPFPLSPVVCPDPVVESVARYSSSFSSPVVFQTPWWISCTLFFPLLFLWGIPDPVGGALACLFSLFSSPVIFPNPVELFRTPWLDQLHLHALLPPSPPCGIPDPVVGSVARYFSPFSSPVIFPNPVLESFQTPWLNQLQVILPPSSSLWYFQTPFFRSFARYPPPSPLWHSRNPVGESVARCSSPSSSPLVFPNPVGESVARYSSSSFFPVVFRNPVVGSAARYSPPLLLPPVVFQTPWLISCTLFFPLLLPCGIPDPVFRSFARYSPPPPSPVLFQTP
ncbi:hypothetical protein C7M84_021122 [Penaeus vannamei]|uniref:Uncharacterized protein n=1 Tax=Penaeus vannamei TaxID=6689 RepID=A0A3R7LWI7_PENVA|nr:hypothetical protein C7M84_021122 [Penaeus vannamei]